MKKLIALAIVAVMLVAMAANVLATETVYATAVKASETNIGDGKLTEYGDPVTFITSTKAYDDESEDEIEGCQSYLRYNSHDPFEMNAYIYIAWDYENNDRLYFGVDMLNADNKFVGLSEDPWNNEAIQFRMSADKPATDDDTLDFSELWGEQTFNIIYTAYTTNMDPQYVTPGFVFQSFNQEGTGKMSATDHAPDDRGWLLRDGHAAGSIGVWEDRVSFELILKNSYWMADPVSAEGREFACSFAIFNAFEGSDNWAGMLTWGHGISGYNNGLGKTGTNKVVLGAIPTVPPVTEEPPIIDPPETGDALVVVIASAVMALGTALIVKKVK